MRTGSNCPRIEWSRITQSCLGWPNQQAKVELRFLLTGLTVHSSFLKALLSVANSVMHLLRHLHAGCQVNSYYNEQILECLHSFPSFPSPSLPPLSFPPLHSSPLPCNYIIPTHYSIHMLIWRIPSSYAIIPPWHCGSWSRHLTQARSRGLPDRNFGLKTKSWVSPSLVTDAVKFKSQNSCCLHIDETTLWRQ